MAKKAKRPTVGDAAKGTVLLPTFPWTITIVCEDQNVRVTYPSIAPYDRPNELACLYMLERARMLIEDAIRRGATSTSSTVGRAGSEDRA